MIGSADIIASAGWVMAEHLLAAGYWVYWKSTDALQRATNTWHFQYSTAQTALQLDQTFLTALASCKGIVTLLQFEGDAQDFIVKATVDGLVPVGNYVPVPTIMVDVSPVVTREALELGTGVHWRMRRLEIYGLARNTTEQRWFCDQLPSWFDVTKLLPVKDFATGNGTVVLDKLRIDEHDIDLTTNVDDASVVTYEFNLTAGLLYYA